MVSLIQNIIRLANITFTKSHLSEEVYRDSLAKLRRLTSQLTSQDVNLSQDLITNVSSNRSKSMLKPFLDCPRAPISYICIHDGVHFSACIFAIRNHSARIPLHDHPGMTGLIKVIHGNVKVSQYTPLPRDSKYSLPNQVANLVEDWQKDLLVPTIHNGEVIISSESEETCLLCPTEKNLHEVSAYNGPAAFVDILSPPYNNQDRECHYYSVVATVFDDVLNKEITWLLESVNQPDDFWCDELPYTGPKVTFT